jgi:hypothetical protein
MANLVLWASIIQFTISMAKYQSCGLGRMRAARVPFIQMISENIGFGESGYVVM